MGSFTNFSKLVNFHVVQDETILQNVRLLTNWGNIFQPNLQDLGICSLNYTWRLFGIHVLSNPVYLIYKTCREGFECPETEKFETPADELLLCARKREISVSTDFV